MDNEDKIKPPVIALLDTEGTTAVVGTVEPVSDAELADILAELTTFAVGASTPRLKNTTRA